MPINALPSPCVEVTCDSCKKPLEGDGDGIVHFTSVEGAATTAEGYDWEVEDGVVTCIDCIETRAAKRFEEASRRADAIAEERERGT